VATNRSWTDSDGERQTETEWFNIVAWGKLAEICNQYLSRGQQVYIEGRLHTRTWQDSEGQDHTTVEVIAKEMIMLTSRDASDEQPEENQDQNEEEFPF
jgi:single-strand DNA-binding protein